MDDLIKIERLIHEIRGRRVMLDFDLARVYGIETRVLKQSVKRNISRFPDDFMFVLTSDELASLRSQFVISNSRGGTRYLPYAFTEQGVAMLSSILNSETAIQLNIQIMRTFAKIRQLLSASPLIQTSAIERRIDEIKADMEEMFADQNDINEDTRMQLELIGQALAALQRKDEPQPQRRRIGFKRNSDE